MCQGRYRNLPDGLLLAIPLGRLMGAMLFEVQPADPLTLGGVAIVLAIAGLLAN
jgi:hypothetical protein